MLLWLQIYIEFIYGYLALLFLWVLSFENKKYQAEKNKPSYSKAIIEQKLFKNIIIIARDKLSPPYLLMNGKITSNQFTQRNKTQSAENNSFRSNFQRKHCSKKHLTKKIYIHQKQNKKRWNNLERKYSRIFDANNAPTVFNYLKKNSSHLSPEIPLEN